MTWLSRWWRVGEACNWRACKYCHWLTAEASPRIGMLALLTTMLVAACGKGGQLRESTVSNENVRQPVSTTGSSAGMSESLLEWLSRTPIVQSEVIQPEGKYFVEYWKEVRSEGVLLADGQPARVRLRARYAGIGATFGPVDTLLDVIVGEPSLGSGLQFIMPRMRRGETWVLVLREETLGALPRLWKSEADSSLVELNLSILDV